MISPKYCFTKKAVNKWPHISEAPPNQPDYPWFSKCTLNLGLEKPMLINSATGRKQLIRGKRCDVRLLNNLYEESVVTFVLYEENVVTFVFWESHHGIFTFAIAIGV